MLTTLTVGLHISALGNTVIVNAKIIHKPKVPTYTLNLVELITGIGLDGVGSFKAHSDAILRWLMCWSHGNKVLYTHVVMWQYVVPLFQHTNLVCIIVESAP